MKKNYKEGPCAEIIYICSDEIMQIAGASEFDNDGDGITDQFPVEKGDPDGGIGAKRFNAWEDTQSSSPWSD